MHNMSSTYQTLLSNPDHIKEYRIGIAQSTSSSYTYYDEGITDIETSGAVFSNDELSIGAVISREMKLNISLDLIPSSSIYMGAKISPFVRPKFNNSTSNDWVQKGVFLIDTREEDIEGNTLDITLYDSLMKTEQKYMTEGDQGIWPRSAYNVIVDCCQKIGVSVNSTTLSRLSAKSYMIPYTNDSTMRDVMASIAGMYGGNFILNDSGELQLILLSDILVSNQSEVVATINDMGHCYKSSDFLPFGCVVMNTGNETYISGTESDNVRTLEFSCNNPPEGSDINATRAVRQAIVDNILSSIRNKVYHPFEATEAVIDPAIELGDKIKIVSGLGTTILSAYCKEEITFDLFYQGSIYAPKDKELDHEYPFKTESEKKFERLADVVASFRVDYETISAKVATQDGKIATLGLSIDGLDTRVQDVEGEYTTVSQRVSGLSVEISGVGGRVSTVETTIDGLTVTTTEGTTKIDGSKVQTSNLVVTNSINIANRFVVDSSGDFFLKDNDNTILEWNKTVSGKAAYLEFNGDLDMDGHELAVSTINASALGSTPWYITQNNSDPSKYELHGLSLVDATSLTVSSITLGGVTKTSWPSAATAVFG